MTTVWYIIISFMLVTYVVLDGRNFGAGILHWLVAKTPEERRQVIAAIGPLWSWHEVWLVGFGGTLFAVFPHLLASSFAGYYLALFLILWSLILRGVALEVGGHLGDRMWQQFWDFVFVVSSFLLALLFGVAAGNLVRGVPLDREGNFTMAFFTDFNVYGYVGLLDWYTVSIGVFATLVLAAHGATYLTLKTEGPVHDRSAALAKKLWIAAIPLFAVISAETWFVRPDLADAAVGRFFCWLGLVVIGASVWALVTGIRRGHEWKAFLGSNFLIVGLMATGAAAFFPVMLHSTLAPEYALTANNSGAGAGSLLLALVWWPVSLVLAASYFVYISKRYAGKVSASKDTQGYY
jgi:cytochrome d ubiquinol oxidase subunit II